MKPQNLFTSMNALTPREREVSNKVTLTSLAIGVGAVLFTALTLPAQAQRMTPYGGGGNVGPSRPAPPVAAPTPPPAPVPPAVRPQPAPPVVQYGTFRAYGPLPEGRVRVHYDSSFRQGQILGYTVYTQDNGEQGNDQMLIDGPAGREEVWLNCWQSEEWKSFGPNSEQFVHAVVTEWCGWEG